MVLVQQEGFNKNDSRGRKFLLKMRTLDFSVLYNVLPTCSTIPGLMIQRE